MVCGNGRLVLAHVFMPKLLIYCPYIYLLPPTPLQLLYPKVRVPATYILIV